MYIYSRKVCSRYAHGVGWLRWVGSIKLQVSFAEEPYTREYILQKRPIIWSFLLTVATPPEDMQIHHWHLFENTHTYVYVQNVHSVGKYSEDTHKTICKYTIYIFLNIHIHTYTYICINRREVCSRYAHEKYIMYIFCMFSKTNVHFFCAWFI